MPTRDVFVGRQSEMGLLRATLAEAIAGSGRCVMLSGEPGIGKTRTCQEIAAYAGSQGALALRGRCVERSGPVPYWPWVQVLRAYVRDCAVAPLRAAMGLEAAMIAALVPEVREKFPDLHLPPSVDDPEQGRLRLFDAITTFLQRAAQRQPLVAVFENLHWADRSSLLLLEFLVEELSAARLLVLGTYRDTDLSRAIPCSRRLASSRNCPPSSGCHWQVSPRQMWRSS